MLAVPVAPETHAGTHVEHARTGFAWWLARLEQNYARDVTFQSILNFPTGYAMSCRGILKSLDACGVRQHELVLNSVGDRHCRPAYVERLKEALRDRAASMCADCQRRAETNPLRVLDSKREQDAAPGRAPHIGHRQFAVDRDHLEGVATGSRVPFANDRCGVAHHLVLDTALPLVSCVCFRPARLGVQVAKHAKARCSTNW